MVAQWPLASNAFSTSRSCIHCNLIILATVLRTLLMYNSAADNFLKTPSDAPLIFLKSITSEMVCVYPNCNLPPCPILHSSCKQSINLNNRLEEQRLKSITSKHNSSSSSSSLKQNLMRNLFGICCSGRPLCNRCTSSQPSCKLLANFAGRWEWRH